MQKPEKRAATDKSPEPKSFFDGWCVFQAAAIAAFPTGTLLFKDKSCWKKCQKNLISNYQSRIKFLWNWTEAARDTELTPLAKAADMVEKHAEGILNFLWHPITNAAAEGINSIIQSLKHAARGLPNFESFRSRILFFLDKLGLSPA